MKHTLGMLGLSVLLVGCGTLRMPASPGESYSGFQYIPIDPMPVVDCGEQSCASSQFLRDLPDHTVRMAIRELGGQGSVGFGVGSIGSAGRTYDLIMDHANTDVVNLHFLYRDSRVDDADWQLEELRRAEGLSQAELEEYVSALGFKEVIVPVYVGVGLRITAQTTVLKGDVNLSSLATIGIEADANRVTGTLVTQTLGITGEQVSTSLPLPKELNATTIVDSAQSIGAIKAILYRTDGTVIVTPRVVGLYNPFPNSDPVTVMMLISELSRYPIRWRCATD